MKGGWQLGRYGPSGGRYGGEAEEEECPGWRLEKERMRGRMRTAAAPKKLEKKRGKGSLGEATILVAPPLMIETPHYSQPMKPEPVNGLGVQRIQPPRNTSTYTD